MHLSYGLRLPTDVRHVPVVRHLAIATLTELGVSRGSIDDIALAVTEACSNVVQHAGGGDFEVRVSVEGEWCRIEVLDGGAGFDPAEASAAVLAEGPSADLTHGRGLGLMRILVDQLHFEPRDGGTTVVLLKHLVLREGSVLAAAVAAATAPGTSSRTGPGLGPVTEDPR
ncbi:serine/threonine-protein kinase RsbW [Quadrisphaera granulorum]|uniref:Serine/threonine-protein kinase RsbW n=1 Tax=Quadrisphaera granulorum TaxID=317664 RepID=A0A316ACK4_9ACTN|nr:ATP-binding protein [Quadrisphaera granulorum]PWJ54624.1 serine/threonine-protein kinase RsbW [Quadrisphaera granulorum]SZE95986.1 serine/threonine-protein kinase RsbW [Quadrisphaera granulorum]